MVDEEIMRLKSLVHSWKDDVPDATWRELQNLSADGADKTRNFLGSPESGLIPLLKTVIATKQGDSVMAALKVLSNIASYEDNAPYLCSQDVGLLPALKSIIIPSQQNDESLNSQVLILCSLLAANDHVRSDIASEDLGLLPILLSYITPSSAVANLELQMTVLEILSLLSLAQDNVHYLGSRELGLVSAVVSFVQQTASSLKLSAEKIACRVKAMEILCTLAEASDDGIAIPLGCADLGLVSLLVTLLKHKPLNRQTEDPTLTKTLDLLWCLSAAEENKLYMSSQDLGLVAELVTAVKDASSGAEQSYMRQKALQIFKQLSDSADTKMVTNVVYMGSPDLGLVALLVHLASDAHRVEERHLSLQILLQLAAPQCNKLYFAHPDLGLLNVLLEIIRTHEQEQTHPHSSVAEGHRSKLACIAALELIEAMAQSPDNALYLGSPQLGLVPILTGIVNPAHPAADAQLQSITMGILHHLAYLSLVNISYMSSPLFALIPSLVSFFHSTGNSAKNTVVADKALQVKALVLLRHLCHLRSNFTAVLVIDGSIVALLEMMRSIGQYSLQFEASSMLLLALARESEVAEVLRVSGAIDVVTPLIDGQDAQALTALLLLTFILARDEVLESGAHPNSHRSTVLLQGQPRLLEILLSVLANTLAGVGFDGSTAPTSSSSSVSNPASTGTGTGSPHVYEYSFGRFSLSILLSTLRALSISSSNRAALLAASYTSASSSTSSTAVMILWQVLQSYVANASMITAAPIASAIAASSCNASASPRDAQGHPLVYVGGGGMDLESAAIALESLVQLSYDGFDINIGDIDKHSKSGGSRHSQMPSRSFWSQLHDFADLQTVLTSLLSQTNQPREPTSEPTIIVVEEAVALSRHRKLMEFMHKHALLLQKRLALLDPTNTSSEILPSTSTIPSTTNHNNNIAEDIEPLVIVQGSAVEAARALASSSAMLTPRTAASFPTSTVDADNSHALEQRQRPPQHHPSVSVIRKHIFLSLHLPLDSTKITSGYDTLVRDLQSTLQNFGILEVLCSDQHPGYASALEAIDHSHTVVVCVQRGYKESVLCREEAEYALHQRQDPTTILSHDAVHDHSADHHHPQSQHATSKPAGGYLKRLLYVMLDSTYTTATTPAGVDGWLARQVGDDLWYPLWTHEQVDHTAREIAKLLGIKVPPPPVNHGVVN